VLSGRGLCDGPITRPEESYRMWCVWVWSWSLDNEEALAHWGLLGRRKGKKLTLCVIQMTVSLPHYRNKCKVCTQIPRCTACFWSSPPKIPSKVSTPSPASLNLSEWNLPNTKS
jgi:hypothetical protein